MDIQLTPDQDSFVRHAIQEGRIGTAEEAVQQALDLWEERERRRIEILASLDQAEASIARGEGIVITPESMHGLVQDIMRQGRARLNLD